MGSMRSTRTTTHMAELDCKRASLLQFTFVSVLLVRSFISGVGFTQSSGLGVASASLYVPGHYSVSCRNRLFCQLDQESHFSLQHNRLDISGWRSGVFANRYRRDSNRTTLCLAICRGRNGAFVHSRVAIRNSTRSVKVYEGLRKRRSRRGDRSRALHARLLPPPGTRWRGRTRQLQPLGAAIQSLALARLDCIPMRWFSATVFQEILHKEEHG